MDENGKVAAIRDSDEGRRAFSFTVQGDVGNNAVVRKTSGDGQIAILCVDDAPVRFVPCIIERVYRAAPTVLELHNICALPSTANTSPAGFVHSSEPVEGRRTRSSTPGFSAAVSRTSSSVTLTGTCAIIRLLVYTTHC